MGESQTFSLLDRVYAYLMLLIGFCFIRFVFWNVSGFFTTVFFVGTILIFLYYLIKKGYKLYKIHWIQFALLLLFSIVFSITANKFIKFLDIIFILISGIYWIYSVGSENLEIGQFFIFDLFRAIILVPFLNFAKEFHVIGHSTKESKIGMNIKLIILGLLITIPLTLIVTILLISADRGLEDMVNALIDNVFIFSFEGVFQFLMGIPVACYLFGMISLNINQEKSNLYKNEYCNMIVEKAKIIPNLVMYSSVTPIILLYVLFFVSQLQYFISAFQSVLPEEFSYAEYARRGFFELFLISIINLFIILGINFLSKLSGENKPILLKAYTMILSSFTILIIATALSKMVMYINKYGLTPLRVYSSWFMIILIVVFVMIIIKQCVMKLHLIKYVVVAFILWFGILCFFNIDGFIAKFNIEMYRNGSIETLDVETLYNLSDDALVCILMEGIETTDQLESKLQNYENQPFETYNLSSLRVSRLLKQEN